MQLEGERIKTFLMPMNRSSNGTEIQVRLRTVEKHLDSYGFVLDYRAPGSGQGNLSQDVYKLLPRLFPIHHVDADTDIISHMSIEEADEGLDSVESAQLRLIESLPHKQLQVSEISSTEKDTIGAVEKIQQYENK